MPRRNRQPGFTLIELLVVMSIIALLIGLLMPALASSREAARAVQCQANLHSMGQMAANYHADHKNYYWAAVQFNTPSIGVHTYYWGSNTNPVNRENSPLLRYVDYNPKALLCPSLAWGTYVPQGGVNEPTTCYGYNGWSLDPAYWGRRYPGPGGAIMPRKRVTDIPEPSKLFVFADSALAWSPAGVLIFQNSTSLDPVTFPSGPNTTPTTHFRHMKRANALCADGSAHPFSNEDGPQPNAQTSIGFVGAANAPHYDQP